MAKTPRRDDYDDLLRNLEGRLERAERAISLLQQQLQLGDLGGDAAAPPAGGVFYVDAGIPKYRAAGGTPKTITIT